MTKYSVSALSPFSHRCHPGRLRHALWALLTALVVIGFAAPVAAQQTLVEYDVGSLEGFDDSSLPPTTTATDVSASNITFPDLYTDSGFLDEIHEIVYLMGWDPDRDDNDTNYLEFTVEADGDPKVSLDEIVVGVGREVHQHMTGPRIFRLYSDVDGFGSPLDEVVFAHSSNYEIFLIQQGVLSANLGDDFDDIDEVTFRIHGHDDINTYLDNPDYGGGGLSNISDGELRPDWADDSYDEVHGTGANLVVTGTVEQTITAPSVTTGDVDDISATSAVIDGEVTDDGGDDITDWGVVYDTQPEPETGSAADAAPDGAAGTFTTTLENLSPDTTYYARSYATNSAGTSYGGEISFSTLSDNADLASLSLSAGTLEPAFDSDTTSYTSIVDYQVDSVGVSATPEHENATYTAPGTVPLEVGDNVITVEVVAEDGVSTRTYDITVTRDTAVPEVTTGTVTQLTSTSTVIEDNSVDDDGGADIADGDRGVVLSNNPAPDLDDVVVRSGEGVGDFDIEITNLSPNTQYFARAFATNDDGTSYGDDISFTTTPAPEIVSISTAETTPSNATEVHYDVEFSHPVILDDMDAIHTETTGDLSGSSVVSASSSVSGYDTDYVVTIHTGDDERSGTIALVVEHNAFVDEGGSPLVDGDQSDSLQIDRVAPRVERLDALSGSPTADTPVEFEIEFSEPVQNLTLNEFTVSNGTAHSLDGDASIFTFAVDPDSSPEVLTLQVDIDTDAVSDKAGNRLANSASASIIVDRSAPEVISIDAIEAATGNDLAEPISEFSFEIHAEFDASIADFDADNITFSGLDLVDHDLVDDTLVLTVDVPEQNRNSASTMSVQLHSNVVVNELGVPYEGDDKLQLQWEPPVYTVSYKAGDNGDIDGDAIQQISHGSSTDEVTPVADTGYSFEVWSDGSTDNPRSDDNITDNLEVIAEFAINVYSLTYHAGDGGSLDGAREQSVEHGDDGEPVEAIPSPGYQFVQWDDGVETPTRTDEDVSGDIDATAEFELVPLERALVLGADEAIAGHPFTLQILLTDEDGLSILRSEEVVVDVDDHATIESTTLTDGATGGQQTIGTTDQDGFATLEVVTEDASEPVEICASGDEIAKSTCREVIIKPAAPHRLQWLSFADSADACSQIDVDAQLIDSYENPVVDTSDHPVDVTFEATSDGDGLSIVDTTLDDVTTTKDDSVAGTITDDGQVTVTLTLEDADDVHLDWSSPDLGGAPETAAMTFHRGPVDPDTSELTSSNDEIYAYAGTSTLTVVPRDSCELELGADQDVQLDASFGNLTDVNDLGDGSYEALFFTDADTCPDEPATISATVEETPLNDIVDIQVGCAEVATDSPVVIKSGGDHIDACARQGEFTRIEVTPLNPEGGPLPPDQDVTIAEDAPYVIAGSSSSTLDDDTGATTYTLDVGSNRCAPDAPREITVRVGGVPLDERPEIEFNCPPIADVSFDATPTEVAADGEQTSTITIETEDICGTPGFGRNLSLQTLGNATAELTAGEVTTEDALDESVDGTTTVDLHADESGSAGISVDIDGERFESDDDLVIFRGAVEITSPADGDTVDPVPTFYGNAEPDMLLNVGINDNDTDQVEVDYDGTFAWTHNAPLDDGDYTFAAWDPDGPAELGDSVDFTVAGQDCPDTDDCDSEGDETRSADEPGCQSAGSSTPTWPLMAALLILLLIGTRHHRRPTSPRTKMT